jgi:hypothetical protein
VCDAQQHLLGGKLQKSQSNRMLVLQSEQKKMTAGVSLYPPTWVILMSKTLDMLYASLRLGDWRDHRLGRFLVPRGWLDFRLCAGVSDHFPDYLTYQGFLEQTGRETSLQSIQQFAFQTSSTSLADLTSPAGAISLVVMVLIMAVLKEKVLMPYFSKIGSKIARAGHESPGWEAKNEERMAKFGDYFFRLVFRSLTSMYFVYFFYDAEWSFTSDTLFLWKGYPFHEQTPAMIWYYLFQATYVLEGSISLIRHSFTVIFQNPFQSTKNRLVGSPISMQWSQTCKGDFREMAIHHIVTTALVMGSSYHRFTRVGSIIFLLHDVSDIPGIIARLANCVKYKATAGASFAVTIICWYIARLHMLPFYVLWSIIYESHLIVPGVDEVYHRVSRGIFTYLIAMLIVLHTMWFLMFLKIAYAFAFKGEMRDLTIHKEGDEDEVYNINSSAGTYTEVKKKN